MWYDVPSQTDLDWTSEEEYVNICRLLVTTDGFPESETQRDSLPLQGQDNCKSFNGIRTTGLLTGNAPAVNL